MGLNHLRLLVRLTNKDNLQLAVILTCESCIFHVNTTYLSWESYQGIIPVYNKYFGYTTRSCGTHLFYLHLGWVAP